MPQKVLLKDVLFNQPKVQQIAKEIHQIYPSFNQTQFIHETTLRFPELELKARISWIADCLKKYLPNDYKKAVDILVTSLPAPNNPELSDKDFGDFIYASYSEYVAKNGCTREYLKFSLQALHEITQRFSVEDAIRYFINAFLNETLVELEKWSQDSHYHVRRLASEGTRPKLPWSQKINCPITRPIPILDTLFSDKTRFVVRSVANHVNDVSKIDPDLAIELLTTWKESGKQNQKEMDYLMRHALRTLVKQGNLKAMNVLGLSHSTVMEVTDFEVPKQVKMNSALEFSFSITAREDTDVIIDYILYFQNKNGKMNSKKVFKLKRVSLKKKKAVHVSKKHKLNEHMTTRKLYRGQHTIEIQVNGKMYAKEIFLLV